MSYLISFAISVAGSVCGFAIAVHIDLEARWQHYKIKHGRRLDKR